MAETFAKLYKPRLRKNDGAAAGNATADDVHVATALGNDRKKKPKRATTYKQLARK
jgi:hypothetical protein